MQHGNFVRGPALEELSGSADQANLLNAMDQLRNLKINKEIQIPQLVVVGDQNSGKSSVLEALAHVPFPVHEEACTRFPTELILKRSDRSLIKVSIKVGDSRKRKHPERDRLEKFEQSSVDMNALPGLISKAASCMGVLSTTSGGSAARLLRGNSVMMFSKSRYVGQTNRR